MLRLVLRIATLKLKLKSLTRVAGLNILHRADLFQDLCGVVVAAEVKSVVAVAATPVQKMTYYTL
jgi:hypothetical protein